MEAAGEDGGHVHNIWIAAVKELHKMFHFDHNDQLLALRDLQGFSSLFHATHNR